MDFSPDNVHGLLLYDFGASPCARRCRITLLEKGLRWDTQIVDLSRLEQRSPAYLALNPNGFVPTLAHGERVVYESNVITEYLDDAFPDPPLYPDDPWQLARVKMWQSAEAAMAKDYRTLMYQRLMGPILRLTRSREEALDAVRRSTSDAADIAWEERVFDLAVLTPREETQCEERLYAWLDELEKALQGSAFLVGDRFSQAEISVYPRVAMLPFIGLPVRHPAVARWMERLAERLLRADPLRAGRRPDATLAHAGPALAAAQRCQAARGAIPGHAGRALRGEAARPARAGRPPPSGAGRGAGILADSPAREGIDRSGRHPGRAAADPLRRVARETAHALRLPTLSPRPSHPRAAAREGHSLGHRVDRHGPDGPQGAGVPGREPVRRAAGAAPRRSHPLRLPGDRRVPGSGLSAQGTQLYPDDAYETAQVRMWLALEAGTHKEFRPLFYLHVVRPKLLAEGRGPDDVDDLVPAGVPDSHRDWLRDTLRGAPRFDTSEALARSIILSKLDFMEARLEGRAFLVGHHLTMADLGWITRIDLLPSLGIELGRARHPNVVRWHRALRDRPSLAVDWRTHPQPE